MKGRCSITGLAYKFNFNVCQRFVNFENVSMALQKCEKIDSVGMFYTHGLVRCDHFLRSLFTSALISLFFVDSDRPSSFGFF